MALRPLFGNLRLKVSNAGSSHSRYHPYGRNYEENKIKESPIHKRTITENSTKTVPQIIHYIWLGDLIPKQYLINILKNKIQAPGFKVILWTDKKKQLEQELDYHKGICIRDYKELLNNEPKSDSIVAREMVGYANYASASDVLRVVALKKHGGVYLDVDVKLKARIDENIYNPKVSELQSINYGKLKGLKIANNNNVLIAPKNNEAIMILQRMTHKNYYSSECLLESISGRDIFERNYSLEPTNSFKNIDCWHYKRSLPDKDGDTPRALLTLHGTGPGLLTHGFVEPHDNYWLNFIGAIESSSKDRPKIKLHPFNEEAIEINADAKSWRAPKWREKTTECKRWKPVNHKSSNPLIENWRENSKLRAIDTSEQKNSPY